MTKKGSKKFVFTEKFISYADVEIYAERVKNTQDFSFKMETISTMMYLTSQKDINLSKLWR